MTTATTTEPPRTDPEQRPGLSGNGPDDGSGSGDGGGGRGDGDGNDPIGEGAKIPISNAKFAMAVLLCSLVMLFTGFVAAYVVLRFGSPQWPPAGMPPLPKLLWASTTCLLLSSGSMAWATVAGRRRGATQLRLALGVTAALGVLFVATQLEAWRQFVAQGVVIQDNVYGTVFYSITGLHAAHVVGGIILLLRAVAKALLGHYDKGNVEGIEVTAMYWHFVDVVWLVLFAIL